MGNFEELAPVSGRTIKTKFRAPLSLSWLTPSGCNPAPEAQLIHYPQYPESRIGGLLQGADLAPRSLLGSRGASRPGRVLLLGVANREIFAIALPPESPAAKELERYIGTHAFAIRPLKKQAEPTSETQLLAELSGVHAESPVRGCKISQRNVVENASRNAAGTTLETVMGVLPNSRDEPDFHGWELKAHRDSRITLMTPAPTSGAVVDMTGQEFMRDFGRLNKDTQRWDFTGSHTAIRVPGGKATTKMLVSDNEVQLVHQKSETLAMGWRIPDLLDHWARKHERAAYVQYQKLAGPKEFAYGPFIHLGQGIDFGWFWQALSNGSITIDPACNMPDGSTSFKKARYQFRCSLVQLAALYPSVTVHDLRHVKPNRELALANLAAEGVTTPTWFPA